MIWSVKSIWFRFSIYDKMLSNIISHVSAGAKLCMISELLGDSGSVTGIDVARHRIAACRTMLQKYALGDRCRLFVADGTTFSLLPVELRSDSKSCNKLRKWF